MQKKAGMLVILLTALPLKAGNLAALVSVSDQVPGWQLKAPPEIYDTTTIWDKINGGAVPYIDNGMRQAVFGDYLNGTDQISLTCFDQTTVIGAAATYALLDPSGAAALEGIGEAARLDESPLYNYIIQFRSDRYFCMLTGPKGKKQLEALKKFARIIDRNIKKGIAE
jgi:hypothetical protein